ncbi:hypothetical protein CRV08_00910 [Halarcobacter ebronensis]|uniref:Uncharacterized protein n=1 Tax=Halarcobacter ebronensis TaxID=1462615 RepID=A0A4Q0YHM9_9BACT|nr:molecular chaperone TorD family protein [Halarcobacter ebronensis]RXJ70156.1 hypothetical protein CRV08_00910 [Halarcobacter ebronensis]
MNIENKENIASTLQNDAEIFALLSSFYLTNPNGVYVKGISQLEIDDIKDGSIKKELKKIRDYAAICGEDESEENMLELKRDWTKLFRGISPTYGPKPPYAQLYKNSISTDFLSSLAELYLDVGYKGYEKINDRLDYIGVVLDALTIITLLRKKSIEQDNEVEYKRLSLIFDSVVHQYFTSWFEEFRNLAVAHVKTAFYDGALKLTLLIAEDLK